MIYGIVVDALTVSAPTGVERYVRALLTAMMEQSLQPDERVVLYAAKMPLGNFSLPQGWEWKILPFALAKGWTHLRLSAELLHHPPDVLFVPAHEVPLFVSKKTKIVATVHDVAFRRLSHIYGNQAARRQEWAIRRVVKKATRILVVSRTTGQDLIELYGVTPERLAVSPLAVAQGMQMGSEERATILQRYRLVAGKYLFYIGRLEEKKNVVTLIRAFAVLKRDLGIGHPVTLVLAGSYGFGKERITRALAEAPDDVAVLGFVPDTDVAALFGGALALCFPSHYEGFGLPLLEAFAYGVPVIASDIPSSREVAGQAAVFVGATDVSGWVKAMKHCVLDAAARKELIAKGSDRAKAFSWEETAAVTWHTLRDVA